MYCSVVLRERDDAKLGVVAGSLSDGKEEGGSAGLFEATSS
ncbi:MAG: hypothetical protein AB1497_06010 [Bacillota bacterium]